MCRHVRIEWPPRFIGKELNKLEEVVEGSVPDAGDTYTEYPDTRRDEWVTRILPKLRALPIALLIERTGLSRRALFMIRSGRRPQARSRKLLYRMLFGSDDQA